MPTATLTKRTDDHLKNCPRILESGSRKELILEKDGRVLLVPALVDVHKVKGILPPPQKPVAIEAMKKVIWKRGDRA